MNKLSTKYKLLCITASLGFASSAVLAEAAGSISGGVDASAGGSTLQSNSALSMSADEEKSSLNLKGDAAGKLEDSAEATSSVQGSIAGSGNTSLPADQPKIMQPNDTADEGDAEAAAESLVDRAEDSDTDSSDTASNELENAVQSDNDLTADIKSMSKQNANDARDEADSEESITEEAEE